MSALPFVGLFDVGGGQIVLIFVLFVLGIVPLALGFSLYHAAQRGEIATIGLRYLAKIIDLVIIVGLGYFILFLISEYLGGVWFIFGWLLYNWLMVAFFGATLGKMLVGLTVVTKDDRKCGGLRSFTRAMLEYAYLFVPVWLAALVALPMDKKSLSFLDHIVGTSVQRRSSLSRVFIRRREAHSPACISQSSETGSFDEQLRQLARLRDDGIINAADFEQKKRGILNL